MTPVIVGLAAGVAVALFLGRAIRGLLFEVQPTDPLTIAGVIIVLLIVGVSGLSHPCSSGRRHRCHRSTPIRISCQ